MKKFVSILAASFFLIVNSVKAEYAIGVTANFASIETDGTETLRNSAKKTNASVTEEVVVPEIFVEYVGERGALGLAYIPVQELGNKSRSDTKDANGGSSEDTGTYTAKAELDAHVLIYADLNFAEVAGQTVYAKGGIAQATISTLENLNSGSTSQDEDVLGFTVGLGLRGSLPNSSFYKLEGTYTDYEAYEDTSSVNNKIDAETEIYSLKASIGYQF